MSFDSVINDTEKVAKVYFGEYMDQDYLNFYQNEITNRADIEEIINHLSDSNYNRVLDRNIMNDGKVIGISVLYEDLPMVNLHINEFGYLQVSGKDTYKFTENHTAIFDELYQVLVVGNKPTQQLDKRN